MVTILQLKKFNPAFYDNNVYQKDEWTDICDIGKLFDGIMLTQKEYLRVESAYLHCFEYIMDQCNIQKLQVLRGGLDIEETDNYQKYLFGMEADEVINFVDKSWINRTDIAKFLRLMVRGLSGYAVTNKKNFFIWGTGDLYFHLGVDASIEVFMEEIHKNDLFLEKLADFSYDNTALEDYWKLLSNLELR